MKSVTRILLLSFFTLTAVTSWGHDKNAPLNDDQKLFLKQYESLHSALAADDLTAAKKAAASIAEQVNKTLDTDEHAKVTLDGAKQLVAAESLSSAREAFKGLSKKAVHLAQNQPGYFIVHCPMVQGDGGDWVQTVKTISNPYFGKQMLRCGSITSK